MLIKAINEDSKTHFKDKSDDDHFINTKRINYSKKTIQTLKRKRNSCAIISEQYPLANKMKETDYDSATPSLLQEMNLARRACWCNNENSKSNNNNSKITDRMQTNNINIIITNSNNDRQNKSCENCCCNANITIGYDTVNIVDVGDDDDGDNDDDNVVDDDEATTVLNGATFSKNINNCNSINYNNEIDANGDSSDNNDHVDYDNAEMKNINDNIAISDAIDNCSSETLATINISNPNKRSHLIKRKNSPTTTTTSMETTTLIKTEIPADLAKCAPNVQRSDNQVLEAGNFVGNARAQLLKFWLAFVAFCDAITIRHDDPRFLEARKKEQQQREQQQEERKRPKDPAAATTKPAQFKFKLLTSKKVIFLFLVCLFFSCVNRIEGRPNTSNDIAPNDAAAVKATTTSSSTVTAAAAAAAAGMGEIVPAKLTIATSSNDDISSVQPPKTNAISQDIAQDGDKPLQTEAPHSIELSGHDEEILHKAERYPLSQVDFDRVKTPFIIGIWILSASIAKIGFHMTPKLHLIFPESILLIVVGVAIGIVLYFGTEVAVSPLTPNTFFFYMLPPIILDAGYFMPNRMFFDNLGTILLMAVVGTIFNIATIGGSLYACGLAGIFGSEIPKFLDIFLFASLISAVDPVAVLAVFEEIHVNEILYIVVFGESLLNDAVTVVMYHMMEVYNEIGISEIVAQDVISGVGSFFVVALGGTVIGIIWGFLTGLVTRFTDHVRVIEPIFIFVMAYLAYLNAEIFHMSGILAITFCGITMKNYVESNISQKSHTTVKYALKMLSSSSETIIFMFLGVATVNNHHVWNTAFVVLTIAFCSVFRVIGVIILSAMANRFRLHKLSRVDQFVMSYGGLRGAVAFALVLLVDERVVKQKDMFVTTTIAVIYFTVFVQGITIKPLVKFLNVKRANKRKPSMNERIHERFMDHLMAGIEDIVGKTGNYNVRDKFKRFDNRFIRPLVIRDLKGAEPKIIETYSKLTMRDAMEVMRRNPSTIGQITATESMSALFRNYTNNCIGGSPSLTNLDNSCSRNLDMHELDYNPSKKDLTDAKIHHLLAEELKPYRRHRRLSYSRHAVDDRDLSTRVNYKMQMNFRRMFNDRKHHKRSKRGSNKPQEGVKQNHVSFHDFQQNGTTKQFTHAEENPSKLNEVTVLGANDEWDDNDGLTFTAKSSLAENPIPEEDRNVSRDSDGERRVATPTALESQLPWKRQGDESISDAVQQNEFPAWASNKEYLAYNSPSATFLGGINKPKQPKSVIGLFRRESSGSKGGNSLGGGDISDIVLACGGSVRGSDPTLAAALGSMIVVPSSTQQLQQQYPNPRLDKRSQSISAASPSMGGVGDGHSGPFPVTASHRRNVRRGSMMELSGDIIPEETYQHGHSKSLCEPAGDEWNSDALTSHERANSASGNSGGGGGHEPLLPRLTPRAQIRRLGGSGGGGSRHQVTSALLSTSNSEYDDDEDEDFDLYDDENIVVTTTTFGGSGGGSSVGLGGAAGANSRNRSGSGGAAAANTTTTIRLTRNNDESII